MRRQARWRSSFTVDRYGNVTKAPLTAQTGAGIATLIGVPGVPGVPPGNVDLFAPHGIIDAGDASIRVSGELDAAGAGLDIVEQQFTNDD